MMNAVGKIKHLKGLHAKIYIIDNHALVTSANLISIPLALGAGRALKMMGDRTQSRRAYEEFFRLWKDAEEDIPVLMQAKAEYKELR